MIENKEGFLPYSTGKRACPGAKLADMQLFLVLTNILAEFTLSLPKGDKGELGTQFKVGKSVTEPLKLSHPGWHGCAEEPETLPSCIPGESLAISTEPNLGFPQEMHHTL